MLIVLLVFFGVFFCRDVQVLAMQGPAFGQRFAIYALLQVTGAALAAEWRTQRLAWVCVLIQVAELAVAMALTRLASGRHAWLGWMLPSPAFLLTLYGFSLVVREPLVVATGGWLILAGGAGFLLSRVETTAEEKRFVSDLALVTGCTALVFIPFSLV